jgi:hypothetical protein
LTGEQAAGFHYDPMFEVTTDIPHISEQHTGGTLSSRYC